MKKKPGAKSRVQHEPDEELIRDYARHLYEQSGRIPGRDLDNWFEAKACLEIPALRRRSPARPQDPLDIDIIEVCQPPVEARNLAS